MVLPASLRVRTKNENVLRLKSKKEKIKPSLTKVLLVLMEKGIYLSNQKSKGQDFYYKILIDLLDSYYIKLLVL